MTYVRHTAEQKKQFMNRLMKISDSIPVDFANQVLEKKESLNVNRVLNVRHGRTIDFEILELLEKISKKKKAKS